MMDRRLDRNTSRRLLSPTTYFGKVVDDILDSRRISGSEAARRCDFTKERITQMRRGFRDVHLRTLARIEVGLNLTEVETARLVIAAYKDARERLNMEQDSAED